ncbi:MAG: glutamate synthase subunit alpha, partial [Spirochaetia bacterium]|nr:glutamate synthase subunit alpha [Spirochaetia bacterium]
LNNCSVGIATQDDLLQRRFRGMADYLVNFFTFLARDLRETMASLGFKTVEEMVGRSDMLEINAGILPWKAKKLDYSAMLYRPVAVAGSTVFCSKKQDHGIDSVMDRELIRLAKSAIEKKEPVNLELRIRNTDRTTGAMLSGEICKRHGEDGLLADTIRCNFTGVAGQSFGAWLVSGITFKLNGMANDYVGKGIFGGRIIICPPADAAYKPEQSVIIGNTTFYGAVNGEAYIRGMAGERFCIRNSGLYGVVEGVGDHGCEYMTGGRVVILGKTGRNFAAGMSGGIAYVYDEDGRFRSRCNTDMVDLDPVDEEDAELIKRLLGKHIKYTGSAKASTVLDNMGAEIFKFVKVYPKEYKAIFENQKLLAKKLNLSEVYDG